MGKNAGFFVILCMLTLFPCTAGTEDDARTWQEHYRHALAELVQLYPLPSFPLELAERSLSEKLIGTDPAEAAARTLEYALWLRSALLSGKDAQDAQAAARSRFMAGERAGPDAAARLAQIDLLWRRQREKADELGRDGLGAAGNGFTDRWRGAGNGGRH